MFGNEIKETNQLPSHLQNLSPDSTIEMLDRESVPLGLPPEGGIVTKSPEDYSDEMLLVQMNTQGDSPIREETTQMVYGLSGKTEINVVLEEELLPSTSEGKTNSMAKPINLKSVLLCE